MYALAQSVVPKVPTIAWKYWRIPPLGLCVPSMSQAPPTTRQSPNSVERTSRPRRCSSSAFLWAAAIVAALVPVVHV